MILTVDCINLSNKILH